MPRQDHPLKNITHDERTGGGRAWCEGCQTTVRVKAYRRVGGDWTTYCRGPAGNGSRYRVPAQPSRDRLAELTSVFGWGLNYSDIARMSGLHKSTLHTLVQHEWVDEYTHNAISGFTPAWSAVGLRRRVNALLADGYSTGFIADQIGSCKGFVEQLSQGRKGRSELGDFIVAVFDKYEGRDPVEVGIDPTTVKMNRTFFRHYAGAGLWNLDIDDPGAVPQYTGLCGTPEGYRTHYRMRTVLYEKTPGGKTVQRAACAPCREAWRDYTAAQRAA